MDAAILNTIEQALEALGSDESEESAHLAEELVEKIETALLEQQKLDLESAQPKLTELLKAHPWMEPERINQTLADIVRENASVKSRRRKVITIANRVKTALEPYVACKAGCTHCCHMNTMIYEHEAVRLAEVTGRKMVRLPYRPLDQVALEGTRFNGRPCTFLVENKCSVYEDRPLVCRTHHSLREDVSHCSMKSDFNHIRPPMYDPDILEVPYMALSASYNRAEPWGNIAEFFPD